MVKTKIVATLGPASSQEKVLVKMVRAGVEVVRLNFSHGTPQEQQANFDLVKKIKKRMHPSLQILQDLEGPRIRVTRFRDGQPLIIKKRQTVWFTNERVLGGPGLIPIDYTGSLKGIKKGDMIYIDDGNLAFEVKSTGDKKFKAEVMIGGVLKERKGVNIPDSPLKFQAVTEKDRHDLKFAVKNRVDMLALSFVRAKQDILTLRSVLAGKLAGVKIVAKIENKEAIGNIDDIIEAADGIMIARGDMGVSLPIWEVPVVQKKIIKKCNQRGKFVITATQMLESMVEHLRPTRAEVSDVANAVLDGTDYVMLSEETAAGMHPVETVQMMEKILEYTEKVESYGLNVREV